MKVWVLFRANEEWEQESRATPMVGYSDPVTAEAAAAAMNGGCRYEPWGVAEVDVDGPWGVVFVAVVDVVDGQPDSRPQAASRVDDEATADRPPVEWWGKAGATKMYDFAEPPERRDKRPMCRITAWGRLPSEALDRALARQSELLADWDTHVVLHGLEGVFA